ncbi:MAG TPA: aminotransferase class I/II-fold pyridoxal phosphate-dependent enzyme [Rugosimonospora sp.]|nr:aminotransferase class I/II-fold pyridoxal phosphate-dependent enzyme [Rugosimonospora sp.]
MSGRIYLSAPDIGELEETFLVKAVRSGWVAPAGPDLDAFEHEMAERIGVPYAVAVSSGTAALHLALLALGTGRGHVVVVPTLTFAATANAVAYTGAEPVFVDCDPLTGNIDPNLLAELLPALRREGRTIAAVIPVDMFGRCADYASLLPLCAAHGVPVLEDAAEALGATYDGRAAGSFGACAALSFNGNKIITTSGGGMLLTTEEWLAAHCRYLSTQARQPVVHYEHLDIGYNYRLSNLLAAVGRAQLRRLDAMMERRRALRERYAKLFGGVPGTRLLGADDPEANCWLTTVVVDPAAAGWSARDLAAHLARYDIETRPVWKPMHLQPVYAAARAIVTGAAHRLFETGLTLPSGSSLGELDVRRVFDTIHEFLERHA